MARKRNKFLDRLAYHALNLFGIACRAVSRKAAIKIGEGLGWLAWLFFRSQKKRIRYTIENLRNLYPNATENELRRIIRQVCAHFGVLMADGARLTLLKEQLFDVVRIEGMDNFLSAWEKNRGAIFATGHFGHFEVANGAFAAMGYPVWSVIRTVDNPDMDVLMDNVRCSTGLGVIKKENAAREILRHLRDKHIVTVAFDQNAAFNNIFIPLFGKLAATFVTPAVMSIRTGAPILPVFSFRDYVTEKYVVRVYPEIRITPTGDTAADIRLIMLKLNEILENAIREAPEQWLWIHRRWKMTPTEADIKNMEREMAIINRAENASASD